MNKATKRFLLISGIYLILLSFILFSRPRSGYTATIGQILGYYLFFLPLWVSLAATILINRKSKTKKWNNVLFGNTTLFILLILSIIIGFVFNFDYKRQSGCFGEDELDYSITKFIWSGGSILFLSLGFFMSKPKFATTLLIIEFAFWTFKSLHYNNSLDFFLPGYFTMICWFLRLGLISNKLNRK